jgi:N-dimethylarginine dimethylaminohydrolase
LYSINEWDTLKKVVVGVADYARIPILDSSLRTVNYADVIDETQIPFGLYPKQVIDEANEDLEKFSSFLTNIGIEVVRPKRVPVNYYNYCPRDTVIVHRDKAVAAPMSLQSRDKEYLNYSEYLTNVIEIPNYLGDDIYNHECIGNPDILALKETYPKFDAANVIRANDDLLYLVSNSGNRLGAEYLRNTLNVNVHLLEGVYSYMHIDSTIAFLREGLMLLNPSRIKDINVLPKPFRNWDYIWCPEPTDIGHYPGYCNASKWINMNLFSVNPNLVVVEEHQISLAKELDKYGIDSALLPLRHQRTLGGGFHCVTLDLIRE